MTDPNVVKHIFPLVKKVAQTFLECGGTCFVTRQTAETILLLAAGEEQALTQDYKIFSGLRLNYLTQDMTGLQSSFQVRLHLRGIDTWGDYHTDHKPDGSVWRRHTPRLDVEGSSLAMMPVASALVLARFQMLALSLAEELDRVIREYGEIQYMLMSADDSALAKKRAEDQALRNTIESELRDAVDIVRKNMRVGGRVAEIDSRLVPLAILHPGDYNISFSEYKGKVIKEYRVSVKKDSWAANKNRVTFCRTS